METQRFWMSALTKTLSVLKVERKTIEKSQTWIFLVVDEVLGESVVHELLRLILHIRGDEGG